MDVLVRPKCECLTLNDDINEKDGLLEEIDSVIGEKKELSVSYFLTIVMMSILAILIAFPKVFLTAQIYYKSRSISFLERELQSLRQENKIILKKVEKQRYKNQILDTIF